ncbi:MAG TPA: DUF3455 domain-containing protein [Polyangiaceae bacterium]|jgi:hypothetical protein
MKRFFVVCVTCALPACSSSSGGETPGGGQDAGGHDATGDVSVAPDGSVAVDASPEAGVDASLEAGADASVESGTGDAAEDASDGGCPASWLVAPTVDPSIAVPADGGSVLLHASGSGTQNYTCTAGTDGGASWVLTGPSANLNDCTGTLVGHHFASDGGAAFPEWQTLDGTYVVGHKLAPFTPDGGSGSVPWLLLQGVDHGGTGTLSEVAYVQRLFTDGGNAPASACDAGDTVEVPYGASYYFYGP